MKRRAFLKLSAAVTTMYAMEWGVPLGERWLPMASRVGKSGPIPLEVMWDFPNTCGRYQEIAVKVPGGKWLSVNLPRINGVGLDARCKLAARTVVRHAMGEKYENHPMLLTVRAFHFPQPEGPAPGLHEIHVSTQKKMAVVS